MVNYLNSIKILKLLISIINNMNKNLFLINKDIKNFLKNSDNYDNLLIQKKEKMEIFKNMLETIILEFHNISKRYINKI